MAVWQVGRAFAAFVILPSVSSVGAALGQTVAKIWAVLVREPCVIVAAVDITVTTEGVLRVSITFKVATNLG